MSLDEAAMTITLRLSSEQEKRLRAGAARRDARAMREILIQAVDSTVEGLLQASAPEPQTGPLSTLLDGISSGLRDAPALPDQAVSRAGIYAGHP
jgi:hypothetical protein